MSNRMFLALMAMLVVLAADAQISQPMASSQQPLSLKRVAPRLEVKEMQWRAPGTPVRDSESATQALKPFYRRPAGAFYCSMIAKNGVGGYSYNTEFVQLKPFADYTLYSWVDGADANTHYFWDVYDQDGGSTQYESEDCVVSYGLDTRQDMPKLLAVDGDPGASTSNGYEYQMPYYRNPMGSGTGDDPIVSSLPVAQAWATVNPQSMGDEDGIEYLLSSKTTCARGRNGDLYNTWVTYYGATPCEGYERGWWFGKNASHIDGMAQVFERPEHPYVLTKVYMMMSDDLECTAPVKLHCKVYRLNYILPYDDEESAILLDNFDRTLQLIVTGEATITPTTASAKNGYVEFTLYGHDEYDESLVYEYTPTIDFPILIVVDGYNDPEAAALARFSAFISADYNVDEGFGETAYLKYPWTDRNGNFTGEYYWRGLNNFFSIGQMKTAFSIFVVADHPYITLQYPQQGREYHFPNEGGEMTRNIDDNGSMITVDGLWFLSSLMVDDDEWEVVCPNGDDIPDWLDISLEDVGERDEGHVVQARVQAEPLSDDLDYREAIVRFRISGDYFDYKFTQGEKTTPFPPDDEINIATINAIINVILGGHVDDDILRQLDFNQDGEISIADVNAVVKIILES